MLDFALRYSPLVSVAAPVATLLLVGWLSRFFVPLGRYERDRADLDGRMDVVAAGQKRQAEELRKKPDAVTTAELADAMNTMRCELGVQGESLRAMRDAMERMDRELAELRRYLMRGQA